MNKALIEALPYLIGGSLFLIGAARFLANGDKAGTVVAGFAGLLAFCLAIANYSRKLTHPK